MKRGIETLKERENVCISYSLKVVFEPVIYQQNELACDRAWSTLDLDPAMGIQISWAARTLCIPIG